MNTEGLLKLFATGMKKPVARGEVLLRPDEVADKLFYIHSGLVRQYAINDEGNKIVLHIYGKGSAFPLDQLHASSPATYFFETNVDSVIGQVSLEKAKREIESNHSILMEVIGQTNQQLMDAYQRLMLLMSGDAKEKVIYELVRSCKLFGETADDGSIFIHIHEDDIANQLGLTRETVSRVIQRIDSAQLVTVSHTGIQVHDIKALTDMLKL